VSVKTLFVFALAVLLLGTTEDVSIPSGGIRLAATYTAPATPGRHPAVVLLAGSGKETRDNVPFQTLERYFSGLGIGVLAYDKRGVGQSGGAWNENEPLDTYAADGLAAVDYLASRTDVDPKRIGVWGISQGGWVGPLIASKSPKVAFVISVSGPGVSNAEQAIFYREAGMRTQGFSDADIAEARNYRRIVWAYYGTGLGREAALSALEIARNRQWFSKLGLSPALPTPAELDPGLRAFMQQAAESDPVGIAQRVNVPVLAIFGAKDSTQPVSLGIENLIQAYARAGNRNATFVLLPDGGHGMELVTGGVECHECAEKEMEATRRWNTAPGFFEAMTSWLRKYVLGGRDEVELQRLDPLGVLLRKELPAIARGASAGDVDFVMFAAVADKHRHAVIVQGHVSGDYGVFHIGVPYRRAILGIEIEHA